jgi:hypothetical protein
MSEYIQFFISKDKQNFLPIAAYSRNNPIYKHFQGYVPYEKVKAINKDILSNILNRVCIDKDNLRESLFDMEAQKDYIATFNNSVEDKREAAFEIDEEILEIKDEEKELEVAYYYIGFLYNILEESGDENNYLYAGIEVGDNPKIEEKK